MADTCSRSIPQELAAHTEGLALPLKGAKLREGFLSQRAPASPQRRGCRQQRELQQSSAAKPRLGDALVAQPTPSTTCSIPACSSDPFLLSRFEESTPADSSVLSEDAISEELPVEQALCDLVGDAAGRPMLSPTRGGKGCAIEDLPADTIVNIRVFRFFEDLDDEKAAWEQQLLSVNSGSLLWLPVHMEPKLHSVRGSKYGTLFTVHHIRVKAQHFASGYQMCNEGVCPARTFGMSTGIKALVTGKKLEQPYFWFVTPRGAGDQVDSEAHLQASGWQHVCREGPFDGTAFLSAWQEQGSPLEEAPLQAVLRSVLPPDLF